VAKPYAVSMTQRYTFEGCPDRASHTKQPSGYLAWHAWAEKKARTHKQIRCETCGLWAIWVPKERAE